MTILNNNMTEKEQELRSILLRYINGNKKERENLLLDIVKGKINLNEFKDIVEREGYNKTYKDTYRVLKKAVKEFYLVYEAEKKKNNEEEIAAKAINDLKFPNRNSTYLYYSLEQLEELLTKVKSYIASDKVSEKTKNRLKEVKKDLTTLITNAHNKEKCEEEQTLIAVIEKYYNGNKEEAFEDIMINEAKYYTISRGSNISAITRNRFSAIMDIFREYRKGVQERQLIQKIVYLAKTNPDINGEYKKEFNIFYDMYMKKYRDVDLSEIISNEEIEILQSIISNINEQRTKESNLKARGYDEESLKLLKDLLERYKKKQFISTTTKKVGSGAKRLSRYGISTYLLKFESEKMLSQEDLEQYKEFAQKYGIELLSWIILEKNISESSEKNSIDYNEFINKYKLTDYTDKNALKKMIDTLIKRIEIDESLYKEEILKLKSRAKAFIEKYEFIKAQKYLNENNVNCNIKQLITLINNEQFISSRDSEELDKYEEYLRKAMEVSNSETIRQALNKVKSINHEMKKTVNLKKVASIYHAIEANVKKMTNMMLSGAELVNGKIRPFDIIDYYRITSLSFEEIEKMKLLQQLTSEQQRAWKKFKENNSSVPTRSREKYLQDNYIKNSETREVYRIINGRRVKMIERVEGTGEVVSMEEKLTVERYLNSLNVPVNEKSYAAIMRRYMHGLIPEEALKQEEKEQNDVKVKTKIDDKKNK